MTYDAARSPKRILIAEDEERIASIIARGLRLNGLDATVVTDGELAYREALSGRHDLLVLDIGLPGRDGFAVLSRLRSHDCRIPIVILTARGGLEDTVAGLEGGADDYLSKPFRMAELLARIRLRLRDDGDLGETRLRSGGIVLDLRQRSIELGGHTVELTAREFTLAEMFFRSTGRVLSRQELIDAVWGADYTGDSNIVDVYVRYLRRKVGISWITTVRGRGYRMALDDQGSYS